MIASLLLDQQFDSEEIVANVSSVIINSSLHLLRKTYMKKKKSWKIIGIESRKSTFNFSSYDII
jgi:hypothetical protein